MEVYREFVALDLETTGLNPRFDKIIEIGAVKVKNAQIIAKFSSLINPQIEIPRLITDLTGITTEMVKDAPLIEHILPSFLNFIGELPIIAHNINFDLGFIKHNVKKINQEICNSTVDTLWICRKMFPQLQDHKLKTITDYLQIKLENHHRAFHDCLAVAEIYLKCTNQSPQTQLDLFG
ncbi:MAG TPA: hypothetical protein GXX38_03500 [Clostridia bacterium]|jgi:DNA polymerase-3 subunit alpha (Gram-positive type)|nr:hypothetical protein [Clostridia bacterium]